MSQGGANSNSGSGGTPIEKLTGNSGGPVGPNGSFNIDIVGNNATGINIVGTPAMNLLTVIGLAASTTQIGTIEIATAIETGTLTDSTRAITPAGLSPILITKYVVAPGGAYTTIQSALNAANAAGGGAVWVRPGSYTENLTLYDNTQVIGALGFADTGDLTITGVHIPPTTGSFIFRNVRLDSATHIFSSNAAGSSHLIIGDAFIAVTNGYTFNLPNWTGIFEMWDMNPSGGTNDGCVNNTGGASIFAFSTGCGVGTGKTMITSGSILTDGVEFNCPISNQTGSSFDFIRTIFNGNVTCTNNSTGSFDFCNFVTGASPSLTMSSSGTVSLNKCIINSSNNPSISGAGAGTLNIADVTFISNTSLAGTLTLGLTSLTKFGDIAAQNLSLATPLPVSSGGTGRASLTNHSVLVGAATGVITQVGPSAATGAILASNGAAADPAFTTATYPLTTTVSQILYSSATNTVTGLATANRAVLTTGTTGIPAVTALATDGQLIIGSTAGAPAAASLTAGTNITITPGSNSITIAAAGGGDVTAAAALTDNAVVRGDGGAKGVQTSTMLISDAGEMTNPSQPAFLAYLGATVFNKTGNGAVYQIGTDALTEVFDQGADFNTNGTFTAPVTGRYHFSTSIVILGTTVATTFASTVTASNRNSNNYFARVAGNQNMTMTNNILIDMDAADTVTLTISIIGEAADTDDIFGAATADTFMSGYLEC